MRTCHCLFWKQDNKIATIYEGNTTGNLLKFKGESFVTYANDFWKLWKEYSGYCKGDMTDFCFIYDRPMEIPEEYQTMSCELNDSIWTVEKIRSVSELLQLTNAVDICNENNEYILTLSNQNSKKAKTVLFSKNINMSNMIKENETIGELTPFIQYYIDKEKGEGV